MSDTKIEWCDKVWNPVVGCTKCSPGCLNCYAERFAYRLACMGQKKYQKVVSTDGGVWNNKIYCDESVLNQPLHWRNPRRIFVCSMSDLFHKKVPFGFTDRVFDMMYKCPQHTFLVLTKRPKQLSLFVGEKGEYWFSVPNIHLGISISNQAEADEKIPILLQIPAAVRWLSIEPMLGPIDLVGKDKKRMGKTGYLANYFTPFFCNDCGRHLSRPPTQVTELCRYCGSMSAKEGKSISWVVVGGESGPGARPMHPDWARSIRNQCVAAGVPFYFKQWGEWLPVSQRTKEQFEISTYNYWPKRVTELERERFFRFGKKIAGCKLDGKEWKQLPERK